jgi:hypothetical protein
MCRFRCYEDLPTCGEEPVPERSERDGSPLHGEYR